MTRIDYDNHTEFHGSLRKACGGPSAEKKQKQSIPGLGDFELDGDAPLDIIMGLCQFSEMLAPHKVCHSCIDTMMLEMVYD